MDIKSLAIETSIRILPYAAVGAATPITAIGGAIVGATSWLGLKMLHSNRGRSVLHHLHKTRATLSQSCPKIIPAALLGISVMIIPIFSCLSAFFVLSAFGYTTTVYTVSTVALWGGTLGLGLTYAIDFYEEDANKRVASLLGENPACS